MRTPIDRGSLQLIIMVALQMWTEADHVKRKYPDMRASDGKKMSEVLLAVSRRLQAIADDIQDN